MDKGSWVMFKLPGYAKAESGVQQSSMDALRKASETSWFKDGNTVWVKLVAAAPVSEIIRPTDLQASITVSRPADGSQPAKAQTASNQTTP
jgi:cell migration-inducing and hyaluronan-binding protein